jgi:hypothetical protein
MNILLDTKAGEILHCISYPFHMRVFEMDVFHVAASDMGTRSSFPMGEVVEA